MKPAAIKALSVQQLVDRIASIGVEQDDAILYDQHKTYERLYRELDNIDKELQARGKEARLALLQLYGHPNIQVRLNAAKRTLAVAPVQARGLLEAIAKRIDVPQGGDAGMALRALDRGIFKPT